MSNADVPDEIIFDQEARSAVIADKPIFRVDEFVLNSDMLLEASASREKLFAEL